MRGRAARTATRSALDGGERLEADAVVWACGGWLTELFPRPRPPDHHAPGPLFFDGGPAWTRAPGWVDYDRAIYGTGDLDGLGVKVAPDYEGPPLDPDAELPPAGPANERGSATTSPGASPRSRRAGAV